jgi:hypothetical protein
MKVFLLTAVTFFVLSYDAFASDLAKVSNGATQTISFEVGTGDNLWTTTELGGQEVTFLHLPTDIAFVRISTADSSALFPIRRNGNYVIGFYKGNWTLFDASLTPTNPTPIVQMRQDLTSCTVENKH